MLLLGDQSPWGGGLLRWLVAKEQFPQEEILYFVQDADMPWLPGGDRVSICKGWKTKYWSLATRIPWSSDTPEDRFSESFVGTLKMPKGLQYLVGPRTSYIIANERARNMANLFVKEMLETEINWARNLRELSGKEQPQIMPAISGDVYKATRQLADCHNLSDEIHSLVKHFTDNPVRLASVLPEEYYWRITDDYRRINATETKNGILVPKGKILPLEYATRGWTLGCTGLSYLFEVLKVRDLFIPNLKVKILKISFNWQLDENPFDLLAEVYKKRKLEQAQKRGTEYKDELSEISRRSRVTKIISDYWSGRPTSLSYLILGGNLNPSFEYLEV